MTGKQLRNSILQWAIQGKLVPQDPNDEPASVLLERIRAEKARLVKEKKIKKDKNETIIYRGEDNSYYEKNFATGAVRCIDDEIPFDIPQGWEWARLNSVCQLIEDCPHSTAPDEGDGYPLIRTPNIGFGELNLNGVHRVSEQVYLKRNFRATPRQNDLIFAREAPAGNIAIIKENEKVCLGQRTVLLRTFTEVLVPLYLAYYILSPTTQENLISKSTGTTVAHVNLSDLRPYLIALPPISEQNRIVAKIKLLLPYLCKYENLNLSIEKLNTDIFQRVQKSLLQEGIQGRLVPQIESEGTAEELLSEIRAEKQRLVKEGRLKKSALANESRIFRGDDNKYYENTSKGVVCIDDEIPFEIPNTWCWSRLGSIFAHNTGKALNGGGKGEYLLPYITTSNLYWDRFDLTSVKSMYFSKQELDKCTARKGDLLVCEGGDIGRAAIWEREDICLQNHVHKLRAYRPVCQRYFLFVLWHYKNTGLIGGKGIGIQGLSANALHNLILPIPPITEQRRIADAIDSFAQILSK